MKDPYRKTSMPGATLLCLGGVLMVLNLFFLFDQTPDPPDSRFLLKIWICAGYVLWILGSMGIARSRFSPLWAGFVCGLLLLPGLFLLLTRVPTLSRQQIWQASNKGFGLRDQKRQYRDLKVLE